MSALAGSQVSRPIKKQRSYLLCLPSGSVAVFADVLPSGNDPSVKPEGSATSNNTKPRIGPR